MPDHYTLLGVAHSATSKEIKVAYRRLVAQYHPDLNPDPRASHITATLNEAYAILSDAGKRKAYDAELGLARPWNAAGVESNRYSPGPPPTPRCQGCGRQDSSLRFSEFGYTVSHILGTRAGKVAGVWCERCRVAEAAKWTLLSGFAGWWGIPWGPVRTIQDLALNSRGGRQPQARNAALLRSVGYEFYGRGNYDEAGRALRESLHFKPDAEADAVLDQLQNRVLPHPPETRSRSIWNFALASPILILAVIWAGLIYAAVSALGGYRASHASPATLSSPVAPVVDSERGMVNLEIEHLAGIIAPRSPRIAVHYDGATPVTDYGLDRSLYSAAQLYPIAQSIGALWKGGSSDRGGFLASAYFNSMLFALSVDIVNRIYQGMIIDAQAAQIQTLSNDRRLSGWLRASRFWPAYQALVGALEAASETYKPGRSLEEMETQAEGIQTSLQQLESQQRLFQAEANITGYNRLVPVYNRDLAHLKLLSQQVQAQLGLANQLDLAFNRCLDGSVLLGQSGRVNFTSTSSMTSASH